MANTGIIAEYNPFHNGHNFHIENSRKITNARNIIVCMSPNYVQRGEPAIIDKWSRCLSALNNGADIVIELPSFFACSSAEYFAGGSISILNKTNITDFISFGTETDNLKELYDFSKSIINENDEYKFNLNQLLDKGLSFPSAREEALKLSGIKTPVLSSNNILATEYLKQLVLTDSSIKAVNVKRSDNGYNSLENKDSFASATYIRKLCFEKNIEEIKNYVPYDVYCILKENINANNLVGADLLSDALNFVIRTNNKEELSQILDIKEGIENKIIKSINDNYSFSSICNSIKSKRYTFTSVQRMLLHIILNLKSKDMDYYKNNGFCPYIRVLGFRKDSSALSLLTSSASVPVIVNPKKDEDKLDDKGRFIWEFEKKADDIYYMCTNNKSINKNYTTPPVII